MIRTQIYLTEKQRNQLNAIAKAAGKNQSELIREAIDNLIGKIAGGHRASVLRQAAGIWKDRTDLPDFNALREEWRRGTCRCDPGRHRENRKRGAENAQHPALSHVQRAQTGLHQMIRQPLAQPRVAPQVGPVVVHADGQGFFGARHHHQAAAPGHGIPCFHYPNRNRDRNRAENAMTANDGWIESKPYD